jgi:hypothetical protein
VSPSSTEKGGRHGPTRAEMIEAGGFLNFVRAVRFASRYGVECRKAGRILSMVDYAEARGMNKSQAFREQQAWRKCVGNVSVFEVLSEGVLSKHGYTEDQREAAIARELLES